MILRLARENPHWGYRRIVRELKGVGVSVSATSVRKVLLEEALQPAPGRTHSSWCTFLQAQAASVVACDFFTVDTLWLGRLYVLFFLELSSGRAHLAGCTANPDGRWIVQQARQLAWALPERETPLRFLITIGHTALALKPPIRRRHLRLASSDPPDQLHRSDRLGGLIHEYARAA